MSGYKTRIQSRFAYHGAGYEIILHHVPMIKIGNEWVLNVNPGIIDRLVFEAIPSPAIPADREPGSLCPRLRRYDPEASA